MVSYAMLELEKDAIRDFDPASVPLIQPVKGALHVHKGNGS
jgi:hypothetical protein